MPEILSATALTEVFGDGQRLVAVAVEYDTAIASGRLTPRTFSVEGRRVERASVSSAPTVAAAGSDGRFVVLELAADDATAPTWTPVERGQPLLNGHGAPRGPQVGDAEATGVLHAARARFVQEGDVVAVDGRRRPGGGGVHETDRAADPLVDRFEQHAWTDPATGVTLRYNLFVPDGYRPDDRYPLVLFLHDAGAIAADTRGTLAQGLGAVRWASPADQAEHPCFVLAPQYDAVVVDDRYVLAPAADATRHLLEHVVQAYTIDPARLYATGQSMGAMIAMGLAIADPRLFAAIYAVGGQWPAEHTRPLATTALWVAVSEGDAKAYPEQSATMAVLKATGALVARASWDGRSDPAAIADSAEALARSAGRIKYATFVPGSVDRLGRTDPLAEHTATWRLAYDIRPVREWVMRQGR